MTNAYYTVNLLLACPRSDVPVLRRRCMSVFLSALICKPTCRAVYILTKNLLTPSQSGAILELRENVLERQIRPPQRRLLTVRQTSCHYFWIENSCIGLFRMPMCEELDNSHLTGYLSLLAALTLTLGIVDEDTSSTQCIHSDMPV
jgi:hypothetical protein